MSRLIHKTVGDMHVAGFSLAGEETVVAVPEYNVCFDVGQAPREIISIDNICLSHGHMDHAAGIAYYFSQRTFVGNAPGRVIVHRGLAQPIQKLMDIWSEIEGHPSPGQVYGVEHLEDVTIRRNLSVRPFDVNHSEHSLGFALIELRHKLKPELANKSGPQLVALKREGVEIENKTEVTLLTCTGDTAVGRYLDLDFVKASRTLILECTFFDRDHVSRARAGRHVHVDDLPQLLDAVPQAQVLLTHFTRRTELRRAKHILERVVSADQLERIQILMERPPRVSRSPQRAAASPAHRPQGRAG